MPKNKPIATDEVPLVHQFIQMQLSGRATDALVALTLFLSGGGPFGP